MRNRPQLSLISGLLVAFLVPVLSDAAWSQDSSKKKKSGSRAVTKALKKVDRQILSYSPAKAREQLEPVLEEKDPRVDAAMGEILLLERDYDGAVAKLKAASKKSDSATIFVALGQAQTRAKDKGGAKSSFMRAAETAEASLTRDPDDTDSRFALGVAQQNLGQYDEAVASLTAAAAADSQNPRIAFELGMTKMLQKNDRAAFDHFSRAIELYSGFAYAYYYRALAANKIDRKDITVNDLDRFLALAPDAPEAGKAARILQAARG